MSPFTVFAIKEALKAAFVVTILVLLAVAIWGCSYGTYNATGSYPNQDNHKTDNCATPKG